MTWAQAGAQVPDAELIRGISVAPTLPVALQRLTAAAVDYISAADSAGMTLLASRAFKTVAETSELPVAVDALQYRFGGPCLDATLEPVDQVHLDELVTETRWPRFTAAALSATAMRSMLSCRLDLDAEQPFGSLNLYARTAHAFDAGAAHTARLLAAYAAPAVAVVREREKSANLQRALESSRTIGAAIGVLMTRRLITADEAFELLRTASQHSHRKLRDIAADVTETGTLAIAATSTPRRRSPGPHHGVGIDSDAGVAAG